MAEIATLVGKVDGSNIIFKREGSGNWAATIPKNMSGEYVLEVTAFDAAGNTAYTAKMIFMVDTKSLKVVLKPFNYRSAADDNNFTVTKTRSDYSFKEIHLPFMYACLPQIYKYKAVIV